MNKQVINQGDIVLLDFDPAKGMEIQKRRPALVLSKDAYNRVSKLIIVSPITTTSNRRPYLVPIDIEGLDKSSQVNTMQVYSYDKAKRNVQVVGHIDESEFLAVAQRFLLNFDFPFIY